MLFFKFGYGDRVRFHPVPGGDHDGEEYTVIGCAFSPETKSEKCTGNVYLLKDAGGVWAEEMLSLLARYGEDVINGA